MMKNFQVQNLPVESSDVFFCFVHGHRHRGWELVPVVHTLQAVGARFWKDRLVGSKKGWWKVTIKMFIIDVARNLVEGVVE